MTAGEPAWGRSRGGGLAVVAAVAVAYFGASRLGLLLAFDETNATAFWPSSGIAVAALMVAGVRVWPGVVVGAFATNLFHFLEVPSVSPALAVGGAALVAGGNTLEALAGRSVLRALGMEAEVFNRARDAFWFIAVALGVSLIAAGVGGSVMFGLGMATKDSVGIGALTWWLGDAVGILVFTPLLLAWLAGGTVRWTPLRMLEALMCFAAFVPVGLFLFGGWLPEPLTRPLPYMVIPLLLWVVFRFGLREAATAMALTSTVAIWGTANGNGPFAAETRNTSLILVQMFAGTIAATVFALSGAVSERRRLHAALRKSNETLEERVADRTRSLAEVNMKLSEEIRERTKAETQVRHLAHHDALTGLANRRLLDELFQSVEALARRRSMEMAVLFVDIDDFKQINDTRGHAVGDEVLEALASRLEACVRESDLVARFGGDEFVVVLVEVQRATDAEKVADKLIEALGRPVRVGQDQLVLGSSIGVSRYPQDGRDLATLLRCADDAMYEAKKEGKNRHRFYRGGSPGGSSGRAKEDAGRGAEG